jgi:hypothetical protein
MKIRCLSGVFSTVYAGRLFPASLMEDMAFDGMLPSMSGRVLEINADGAPIQLPPPMVIEVVDATREEWAELQAAGYELQGSAPG